MLFYLSARFLIASIDFACLRDCIEIEGSKHKTMQARPTEFLSMVHDVQSPRQVQFARATDLYRIHAYIPSSCFLKTL